MKTKKNIALICSVAGICIFTCAAAANYRISNGYDHLKTSIKNTREITNATLKFTGELQADNTALISADYLYKLDSANDIMYSRSEDTNFMEQANPAEPHIWESYRYNDKGYHLSSDDNGNPAYLVSNYSIVPPNLWGIDKQDNEIADKFIRFIETAADTVVGDLKNNFVCTKSTDEYTTYTITLDSVQIPEIINAGLSMVFSMAHNSIATPLDENGTPLSLNSDTPEYYLMLLGDEPITESVTLNYTVGNNDIANNADIIITFAGNGHTITFKGNASLTDIGTTTIEPLDEEKVNIINFVPQQY